MLMVLVIKMHVMRDWITSSPNGMDSKLGVNENAQQLGQIVLISRRKRIAEVGICDWRTATQPTTLFGADRKRLTNENVSFGTASSFLPCLQSTRPGCSEPGRPASFRAPAQLETSRLRHELGIISAIWRSASVKVLLSSSVFYYSNAVP